MKRHWPVIIFLVLGFVAARQHASLNSIRFEQASLTTELATLAHADPVHDTSAGFPPEISDAELESLRQSARRVYRLRGDVTMAQQQLDKLAPIVTNLTARLQARTNQIAKVTAPDFPPGYISRNELADRGNATPEAALETVWWALSHGNSQRLMELTAEMIGQTIPDDTKSADKELAMFRGFPGYRIVRKQNTGDKVLLGIETVPGARVVDFGLIHTNDQWFFVEESFRNALQGDSGN
jgi:hypothetical protein